MNTDNQVEDDLQLLETMLDDMEKAPDLYKPTNYWEVYSRRFIPEVKKMGLRNFRRRRFSILSSFGATDISSKPVIQLQRTSFRGSGLVNRLLVRLSSILEKMNICCSSATEYGEVTDYFYWKTKEKFQAKGLDIDKCPVSAYGAPEDLKEINGGLWTWKHIQYCSMFIDSADFIKFGDEMIFVELGAGLGRQIEVLAKLYANATLVHIDIPPQLYVANMYLKSVFGDRVIEYQDAVKLQPGANGALPDSARGKIVMLPTWEIEKWKNQKIDVFWNSASFSEMEPDVVVNYLKQAALMRPESIFINALPGGNYWGKRDPSTGGTLEPVKDSYYMRLEEDGFALEATYHTDYFLRDNRYKAYIFKRNN